MDARLTFLYYLTTIIAALTPVASGLTLALLIDRVVTTSPALVTVPLLIIIAVGTHFAIVAINAAVRFGLHAQYYDHVFRYRVQDTFTYRFCEKLTELDVPHLENPEVQTLITQVRSTHQWRVPDFFRILAYATIAAVGAVAAAIALAPFGWWIVPLVIAGTAPRIVLRRRFGELRWWMYGSSECRKLWYLGELMSEVSALRERKVFRTAPALLTRYRAIQARIFSLGKQPLDRYRRVRVIAPLVEGAIVFVIAWARLHDVTSGAMSVGSFAFFVTMLQQLATSSADACSAAGAVHENLLFVRYWNELMALPG